MLTLTSLGGAGSVTGSKHLFVNGDKRILIDCGLFQGLKNLRELNWAPLPIEPSSIDAVVLTHAHLDHSGYLPKLVRDGFRGKIYATAATRDAAELILKDSGHLQETPNTRTERVSRSISRRSHSTASAMRSAVLSSSQPCPSTSQSSCRSARC